MLSLLKDLCNLNGASGDEENVRNFILEKIKPHVAEIKIDPMGNLIVFKKGAKQAKGKLMLAAHMDEVGVIITHITEEGYLKFDFVGGVDRRVAIGKKLFLGANKIPAIVGSKAYHLVSKAEEKNIPKTQSMYLDIGAKSKQQAQELAPVGTYGCFACDAGEFGEGMFKAKAIDDRLGCAMMIKLIEQPLPMDLTFVFTVQEEVGTRGAFGASFEVKPELALVLETTTAADILDVETHKKVTQLGKGAVISYMDGGTIYDRLLYQTLTTMAQEKNIPWQTKSMIAGGNDARTIQRSGSGVRVAAISAPIRYLHGPVSVGNIDDFKHCLSLAKCFIDYVASTI